MSHISHTIISNTYIQLHTDTTHLITLYTYTITCLAHITHIITSHTITHGHQTHTYTTTHTDTTHIITSHTHAITYLTHITHNHARTSHTITNIDIAQNHTTYTLAITYLTAHIESCHTHTLYTQAYHSEKHTHTHCVLHLSPDLDVWELQVQFQSHD